MGKKSEEILVDSVKKITAWFRGRYGRKVETHIADEFEGWVCEQYLTGRSLKTNYEWIAIDFLRKFSVRTGARGSSDALNQPGRKRGEKSEGILEQYKSKTEDYRGQYKHSKSERRRSLKPYLGSFGDLRLRLRIVLIMRYEYDWDFKDIAYMLGVSEQRVSQLHIEMLRAQKKALSKVLSPKKQVEGKCRESPKVSQEIQKRFGLSKEEKRILEIICERERLGMGKRAFKRIPETIQGTIEISSF